MAVRVVQIKEGGKTTYKAKGYIDPETKKKIGIILFISSIFLFPLFVIEIVILAISKEIVTCKTKPFVYK